MRRDGRDRLMFATKRQQTAFIIEAKKKLGLDWVELGKVADAHRRSLQDWANGRCHMSYKSALLLSKKARVEIPKTTKVKMWRDHLKKSGQKGAINRFKKYGKVAFNEENRQKKWLEWWHAKGKYISHPHKIQNEPLPFHIPTRSEKLAEFVGIMLGDGGVSKYQLSITLHRYDDRLYSYFVKKLIKELFHLQPNSTAQKNALADTIFVSRIKLVDYAINNLGLVLGNKVRQQVDVPIWIKRNKKFAIACVRGLIDTDGCIFTHTYKVKGKWYAYKKISFTNFSTPLRLSVYDFLQSIGINCRLAGGKDVRIDGRKDVEKYFRIIGSSNPKHLKRYAA